MNLSIESEMEADGRWLAEVPQLPGVLSYGATRDEALSRAQVLALRVLAEQLEHGEGTPQPISISIAACWLGDKTAIRVSQDSLPPRIQRRGFRVP